MNHTRSQWIGKRSSRSLAQGSVARLLIIAAAVFPIAWAGAAAAPGASGAICLTPSVKGRDVRLPASPPDELLHDQLPTAGAKRGEVTPPSASAASTARSLLANVNLLGRNPRIVRMRVTAYCPCPKCCGPHAKGLTASGCSVTYNSGLFVASDNDLFPLGTHVLIPGYANAKPVEVMDRGSAIKGNHLDVFFPSHEQAKAWGSKWLTVIVSD